MVVTSAALLCVRWANRHSCDWLGHEPIWHMDNMRSEHPPKVLYPYRVGKEIGSETFPLGAGADSKNSLTND